LASINSIGTSSLTFGLALGGARICTLEKLLDVHIDYSPHTAFASTKKPLVSPNLASIETIARESGRRKGAAFKSKVGSSLINFVGEDTHAIFFSLLLRAAP